MLCCVEASPAGLESGFRLPEIVQIRVLNQLVADGSVPGCLSIERVRCELKGPEPGALTAAHCEPVHRERGLELFVGQREGPETGCFDRCSLRASAQRERGSELFADQRDGVGGARNWML